MIDDDENEDSPADSQTGIRPFDPNEPNVRLDHVGQTGPGPFFLKKGSVR